MNTRLIPFIFIVVFQSSTSIAIDNMGIDKHGSYFSNLQSFASNPNEQERNFRKEIYVTGIVINEDNEGRNGAIFYINGNQHYVMEGELINKGIVLDKVEANFVHVSYLYNSELIKLTNDKGDKKTDSEASTQATDNNLILVNAPAVTNNIAQYQDTSSAGSIIYQPPITVSKNEINEFFESTDAFERATFTPFPEGGFLVSDIQPDSIFTTLGFKKWDVIFSANEKDVNTFDDMLWLKEQLLEGYLVRLKIREYGSSDFVVREYNVQ